MKRLLLIISILASVICAKAKVLSNPIFSSTDAPDFQLKEIETKGRHDLFALYIFCRRQFMGLYF